VCGGGCCRCVGCVVWGVWCGVCGVGWCGLGGVCGGVGWVWCEEVGVVGVVVSPCARTFQGLHSVRLWTPTISLNVNKTSGVYF
jgi:hypothetical protein